MRKEERRMFLVMGFWLIQCCCNLEAYEVGCSIWKPVGDADVCCEMCKPGYRIFRRCSRTIRDLCVPCENGTFTLNPSAALSCTTCKQCGGLQVQVEACTKTKNTVCGCSKGHLCVDKDCSVCMEECRGDQQLIDGTCRCLHGTFDDQNHKKCKPWKSKCPHPDDYMIEGDAYTDSKCIANTTRDGENPRLPEDWRLVIFFGCIVAALVVFIIIISVVKKLTEKKKKKKKKGETTAQNKLIITTPTDEPRTLMAIECSFHEPEQVSSTESLATENSDGSTQKLIV